MLSLAHPMGEISWDINEHKHAEYVGRRKRRLSENRGLEVRASARQLMRPARLSHQTSGEVPSVSKEGVTCRNKNHLFWTKTWWGAL